MLESNVRTHPQKEQDPGNSDFLLDRAHFLIYDKDTYISILERKVHKNEFSPRPAWVFRG